MRFSSWLSAVSRHFRIAPVGRGLPAGNPDLLTRSPFRSLRRRSHRRWVRQRIEPLEIRTLLSAAPTFSQSSYSFTIDENSSTIGAVSFSDDEGVYMVSSSDSNFWIDFDGTITPMMSFDYEFLTTNPITFTITISDFEMQSASADVTITVNDVAEAPVFPSAPYSFTIAEDAAYDAVVGTVTATDPQNDAMYSILPDDDAWMFTIDSVTGELKLASSLNYESATSHTITVQAADMSGEAPATTTVTINVTDVAEAPVFPSTPYVFSVAEDAAYDTVIGTVTATDPQNDAMYSILPGDDAWMFTIDSVTGELKLASSLNYESATSHTITVQAADMSGEVPATTAVTINVTDYQPTISLGTTEVVGWETGMLDALITASSPDGILELFSIDFDNDGTFDITIMPDTDFDADSTIDGILYLDISPVTSVDTTGDSGAYTGTVRIHVLGEYEDFDLPIVIGNMPPDIDVIGSGVGAAGTPYSVSVSISQNGPDTITSALVSWGDGTSESVNLTSDTYSHTYTSIGSYMVTLVVTDEDATYIANTGIEIGNTNAPIIPSISPTITSAIASIQRMAQPY